MVGANILSHYLDRFALVTAWLLFVVGLVSTLLGLAFGARVKAWRSFSARTRAEAWGPNLSHATALGSGWPSATVEKELQKRGSASRQPSKSAGCRLYNHSGRGLEQRPHQGAYPVRSLSEAFRNANAPHGASCGPRGGYVDGSILSPSYDEVMRIRAREANERFERAREARLGRDLRGDAPKESALPPEASLLAGGFVYDSLCETNVALGEAQSRCSTDLSDNVAVKSWRPETASRHEIPAHSFGEAALPVSIYEHPSSCGPSPEMCHDSHHLERIESPKKRNGRLPASAASVQRAAAITAGKCQGAEPLPANLKRRSLALAKAARKRFSASSKGTKNAYSRAQTPPSMPSLTQRRLARAVNKQAERERDRLRQLARELQLPTSPGKITRPRWGTGDASLSTYSCCEDDEEYNVMRSSPTNASTAAFTSVSRVDGHLDKRCRAEEQALRRYEAASVTDVELDHPLPAYQPASTHRADPAWDGGEDLGLGTLHGKNNSRLPIASHFGSEWGRDQR